MKRLFNDPDIVLHEAYNQASDKLREEGVDKADPYYRTKHIKVMKKILEETGYGDMVHYV